MDKEAIYKYLSDEDIFFEVFNHQAVLSMEDFSCVNFPHKGYVAKNLFVCDDKKEKFYLISLKIDSKFDLKEFRAKFKTRRLSFVSPDLLFRMLNLQVGSVTPLGILNDSMRVVELFIDRKFLECEFIGVHPNDNTATIFLKVNDLIKVVEKHGNKVNILDT